MSTIRYVIKPEKEERHNGREKRLTTTKILVYSIGSICAVLLSLFVYSVLKFVSIINDGVLNGVATSNPYFVAYATLITQTGAALAASFTLLGYVSKHYMNKSALEFVFKSENWQVDYKLKLQKRNEDLNLFPPKDVKTALDKVDSHIEQAKVSKINKVLSEDTTTKII